MEDGILDIQLMNGPQLASGNAEHRLNGGRLDDGTECLDLVNVDLLGEATKHPPCFVARERPIRVELAPEDPLAYHDVCTCRTRH